MPTSVAFENDALTELMPWFSEQQRAYLRHKAEELGFVFVDLPLALQAAARRLQADELLYYPANVHYTPSGHRVVADALAPVITELRNRPPGTGSGRG
jgi:lysophospholipase L1-like esterase